MNGNRGFQKGLGKLFSALLCVILLFGEAAAGRISGTGLLTYASAAEAAVWDVNNGTPLEGEFKQGTVKQSFTLHVEQDSQVHFLVTSCETKTFNLTLYDPAGTKLFRQEMGVSSGAGASTDQLDLYLAAGDYAIDATRIANPPYGFEWGKFRFYYWIVPVTRPKKSQVLTGVNWDYAPDIQFKTTYYGDFFYGDPERTKRVDTYRIYPHLTDETVNLSLHTNVSMLYWRILKRDGSSTPETLDSGTIGKWVITYEKDHDHEYRISVSVPLEEATEYYIQIENTGDQRSGFYDFKITETFESTAILPYCYTLAQESVNPIAARYQSSYNAAEFLWECGGPTGIASVTGGKLKGLRQGETMFYGYGHDAETQKTCRIMVPVMVEFSDVRNTDGNLPYYYDPVYWAATNGITGGVKDSDGVCRRFDPQGKCTRAQMVSFLWRMAGCPEPKKTTDYPDVKEKDYFFKAVSWAEENGITGGYPDGTFRPQNECNRAQAVSFLYRMAGTPSVKNGTVFSDVKQGAYYYDAVAWAEQKGITGGYADRTFRPGGSCTRAQMVSFLYRYCEQ
ncbi:MAG: S-layer homology domain-containing protein [Lachnospiraceae bacterium]|nr:S-layer homology domain-containing protein [Lachnospiraceae bacterium]